MRARSFRCLAVCSLLAALFALSSVGCGNDGCPKDLVKSRGTACTKEEKVCSETTPFHNSVMCTNGRWVDTDTPK